ncbi:MAG: hypothetical protein GXO26_10235 [Crenarchaeota archaeon]|nr:hypothetical protein [Thermoproteota archaeon]
MVSIQFKVIESLHFGGPGEFSPAARGPATHGRALTIPLPSTVLGLLANLCREDITSDGTLRKDYEIVRSKFGTDIFIRGPYLISENGRIYMTVDNLIIELSREDNPCSIYRYLIYTFAKMLDEDNDKIRELTRQLFSNKVRIVKFLGVGLRRDLKIADEEKGLLYLEEYVTYDIEETHKKVDVYISVDIVGIESIEKTPVREGPVRLGGEQRVTKMIVREDRPLVDLCRQLIEDDDYHLLIHITPTIIEAEKDMYITYEELSKQLFENNGKIICCIGKFGKDPLSIINLGFNEIKKARRPLKYVITPGSITIVKGLDKHMLYNICEKGIENKKIEDEIEYNRIGYNTVLIIPLSRLRDLARELTEKIMKIAEG